MKKTLLLAVMAALVGCVSPDRPLDDVRVSMDKDQVLRTAGNPKYTYRSENQDHWVYFYESGDRMFSKTLTFEAGRVVQVGRPQTKDKDAATKDLEDSSSMEEFERKARALQKAKTGTKFKNMDGGG